MYAVILIRWPRSSDSCLKLPSEVCLGRTGSKRRVISLGFPGLRSRWLTVLRLLWFLSSAAASSHPNLLRTEGKKHKKQSLLPFTVIADKQHFPLLLLAERCSGILHDLEGGPSNFPIQWFWLKSVLFVLYSAVEEQLQENSSVVVHWPSALSRLQCETFKSMHENRDQGRPPS